MDFLLCRTVYQLVVALQMKHTFLNDRTVDLMITDEIPNADILYENIKKLKLFRMVFLAYSKSMRCVHGGIYNVNFLRKRDMMKFIKGYDILNREIKSYHNYYFANLGGFSIQLARLMNNKNRKIKFHMFEDGVSSYSNVHGKVINNRIIKAGRKNRIKYLFLFDVLAQVKTYYVFEPKIMVWEPKCMVKCIPKDNLKTVVKDMLNQIFSIHDLKDTYQETVIFFEESYAADGIDVRDIELVKRLEEIYRKEEIFIKTHPRNSTNRFHMAGYKTNVDKHIPWEAIALNIELGDKILSSMTSTAVVSTFLLLGPVCPMIMEYEELRQVKNERVQDTIEVIDKMKQVYPEAFLNISELNKHNEKERGL